MASYEWPPQIGSGGTVTSVSLSAPVSVFVVSGSPVTSSGTLTLSFANQSANTVFAGPSSGPSAPPTFRALVSADIPALSYVSSVTASSPLFSSGGLNPNLTIQQASGSQSGYLSSTDWTTFNNKQPAGSYITALTGDATASGPGSAVLTLATVNSNVGSFGDASHSLTLTVNGKGLITAVSSNSIQIAESQVTNLVSDLAGKQPVGNYITALTGDVTASGPGSAVANLVATTNSTLTTLSALSLPGSQVTGNISGNAANITATSNSTLTTLSSLSLPTSQLTGVLSVSNGGTGQSSLTLNNVILGNGTGGVQFVAPGTSGNVLTSNGTTWQSTAPATSSPVVASIGLTTAQNVTANNALIYDTVIVDTNSGYNTSTGAYTVPFTGYYAISLTAIQTTTTGSMYLVKNGTAQQYLTSLVTSVAMGAATIIHCTSGDTLEIFTDTSVTFSGATAPRYANILNIMQIH